MKPIATSPVPAGNSLHDRKVVLPCGVNIVFSNQQKG